MNTHRACRLGKWYYGEHARPYVHLSSFKRIEPAHITLHEQGKVALEALRRNDEATLLHALELMEQSSVTVINSIDQMMTDISNNMGL